MHRRILVLGGGPAGVAAARTAARMGAHAVLIHSGRLGGVSTNSGVLPARVLAHAARLKRESGQLGVYGLRATEAELDWPAALRRLFNVVEALHVRKEIAEEARKLGVDGYAEILGEIRFMSPTTIRICKRNNRGRRCGDRLCRRPFAGIPLPGAELAIFPNDIWRMKAMPRSIAIVGTGSHRLSDRLHPRPFRHRSAHDRPQGAHHAARGRATVGRHGKGIRCPRHPHPVRYRQHRWPEHGA